MIIKSIIKEMIEEDITIINCTPYPINVEINGNIETFQPSGIIPRVSSNQIPADFPYPAVKEEIGEVTGLPEQKNNTFLIVSKMVFDASDRQDLIAPNTAKANRNEKGHIVSVPGFIIK